MLWSGCNSCRISPSYLYEPGSMSKERLRTCISPHMTGRRSERPFVYWGCRCGSIANPLLPSKRRPYAAAEYRLQNDSEQFYPGPIRTGARSQGEGDNLHPGHPPATLDSPQTTKSRSSTFKSSYNPFHKQRLFSPSLTSTHSSFSKRAINPIWKASIYR